MLPNKCNHHDGLTCGCKRIVTSMSCFTASEWGDFDQIVARIQTKPQVVELTDSAGYTMLHYAAQHGHDRIVEYLLKNDAVVDAQECGATPLHRACYAGHLTCVTLLLDHGADPFLIDRSSTIECDDALSKAMNQRHEKIVQLLCVRFPSATQWANRSMIPKIQSPIIPVPDTITSNTNVGHLQRIPVQEQVGTTCLYCKMPTLEMKRMRCCGTLACPQCFSKHKTVWTGCSMCKKS